MILGDPHSTVGQLASLLGTSIRSVKTLLSAKLGLSHSCAQRIPHLPPTKQKNCLLKWANI